MLSRTIIAAVAASVMMLAQAQDMSFQVQHYQPEGIWKAAAMGDLPAVRAAVAAGANINERDKQRGYTPLLAALANFRRTIIPALVQMGADVNAVDDEGESALALALLTRHEATVQTLVTAGAQWRNQLTSTNLVNHAMMWGHPGIIKSLLNAGLDLKRPISTESGNFSALALAAIKSTPEVVQLLVSHGADPNELIGDDEITPLMFAANNGRSSTVAALIKAGADVKRVSRKGNTAPTLAALNGNQKGFEILVDAGCPLRGRVAEAMAIVWCWGDSALLKKLSKFGVKSPEGDPVLTLAKLAADGDSRAFALGLADFEPAVGSRMGHSLLGPSVVGGSLDIMQRLRHTSDDWHPNCSDSTGLSQMHFAAMSGRLEALELLISHKANPAILDDEGRTPLMLAAMAGQRAVVEKLIKVDPAISLQDREGNNALDHALQYGHSEVAALLRNAGLTAAGQPAELLKPAEAEELVASDASTDLPATTVGLLPFTFEREAWYPSLQKARDLSAILQFKLGSTAGVTWVEREELAQAEQELVRQSGGRLSAQNALILGRMVKAELLVTGRFGPVRGAVRDLTLSVVDAQRADVLAQRSVTLAQPLALPLEWTAPQLEEIQKAASTALFEARLHLGRMADKPVLAPLFIGNVTSRSNRLSSQGASMLPTIRDMAEKEGAVRVLNLAGSATAASELDLAVSGFTSKDASAWGQVADYFLWGACEEIGPESTPFPEMPVRVTLHLLDPAGASTDFSFETKVSQMQEDLKPHSMRILQHVRHTPKVTKASDAGAKAAKLLFEYATELGKNVPRIRQAAAQGEPRERWAQRVLALSAAKFFDPTNATIAATWLVERWDITANKMDFNSANHGSGASVWQMMDRKSDWRRHLEQFGMQGLKAVPYSPSMYHKVPNTFRTGGPYWVDGAWYVVCNDLLRSISGVTCNLPNGLPPEILNAWRLSAAKDVVGAYTALQKLHHPSKLLVLSSNYALMAETLPFSIQAEWFKMLWADSLRLEVSAGAISDRRRRLTPVLYDLMPWAEADKLLALSESTLSKSGPIFAETDATSIAAQQAYNNRKAFASSNGDELLKAKFEFLPLPARWRSGTLIGAASAGPFAFVSASINGTDRKRSESLYVFVPGSSEMFPLAQFPDSNLLPKIGALVGGEMWLGEYSGQIGRVDLASKRYLPIDATEGFPLQTIGQMEQLGGTLFVSAGETLQMAARDSKGWRSMAPPGGLDAASGRYVRLTASPSAIYAVTRDVRKKTNQLWRRSGASTESWLNLSGGADQALSGYRGAWADREGLWLLSDDAVTLLPDEPLLMPTRIPLPAQANSTEWNPPAIHDGEWLWIAACHRTELNPPVDDHFFHHLLRLLIIHKPTRKYAGCFEVNTFDSPLVSMMTTESSVLLFKWGSTGPNAGPVAELDKKGLIEQAQAALARSN